MSFRASWAAARAHVDRDLAALFAEEPAEVREALGPALAGGKRFRPALVLLVHDALARDGGDPPRARRYAVAVELIHTATLIHDDLVDDDDVRRGVPALHARLRPTVAAAGSAVSASSLATLAGDAGLAQGVALLGDGAAVGIVARALREVWLGVWREARPPFDHEEVARLKTASLFRAACELGALAASASAAEAELAARYGMHLGLAYQMADDAVDRPPGVPGPRPLRVRAQHEAALAAALIHGLPSSAHRAALAEAPAELLAAMLAVAAPLEAER